MKRKELLDSNSDYVPNSLLTSLARCLMCPQDFNFLSTMFYVHSVSLLTPYTYIWRQRDHFPFIITYIFKSTYIVLRQIHNKTFNFLSLQITVTQKTEKISSLRGREGKIILSFLSHWQWSV